MKKVFIPEQANIAGKGLGLTLSYDIIITHEGELKVETKEGESAEFIITLPI
jgi:signal transduction histidine kinase